MTDLSYVQKYFSDQAARWVAGAYGQSGQYPIGVHRVRVAVESVIERLKTTDCRLLDLGCGGGELCLQAAELGMAATGVDIAPGMIDEAGRKKADLPAGVRSRLTFVCADVLDSRLPAGAFDAVTALGLIEYLPDDAAFFAEAARLLVPGGVLAVSCRNRLFNMASFNDYTAREIETGFAASLISELITATRPDVPPELILDFIRSLHAVLPDLEKALEADRKTGPVDRGVSSFSQTRRQHTPETIDRAARAAGFTDPAFIGIHPHPLPPKFEKQLPRFYNHLARAYEVFEKHPISLIWSSTFIAVLRKPL